MTECCALSRADDYVKGTQARVQGGPDPPPLEIE